MIRPADFRLVDAAGRAYSIDSFPPDTVLAIYFGYTTCLRACPIALDNIAAAMDGLGAKGAAVRPVFVDMDPERVDPVNLTLYMQTFGPAFLGLTGAPEAVAEAPRDVRGPGRTPAVQRRSERLRDDAPFADLRDAARRSPALVAARHEHARRPRSRVQECPARKARLASRGSTGWPGIIPTEMADNAGELPKRDAILDMHPIRRIATLEEVAETSCFLAGPSAGYINGETLNVAGGLRI